VQHNAVITVSFTLCCFLVYQKKDGEDKKLKNGDAKVGSGRIIPLKQVQEYCF